jgi:DNA damage-inducible protein 1
MAIGVGSSKILGRVHIVDMEVLGEHFTCSFTVLEDNKVDLLFGLDNLKRHQCCIDLV